MNRRSGFSDSYKKMDKFVSPWARMQEPSSAASLAREEIGTEDELGGVILADLRCLFPCLRFLDGEGNSETVGGRFLSWFQIQGQGAGSPEERGRQGRRATGVAEREMARGDRTTCTLGRAHVSRIENSFSSFFFVFPFTVGPDLSCQNRPMIPPLAWPSSRSLIWLFDRYFFF